MEFISNRNKELSYEDCYSVEMLCTKKELDELINILIDFKKSIDLYLSTTVDSAPFGVTHMHYQDKSKSWKQGDCDFVVYVDMDKTD